MDGAAVGLFCGCGNLQEDCLTERDASARSWRWCGCRDIVTNAVFGASFAAWTETHGDLPGYGFFKAAVEMKQAESPRVGSFTSSVYVFRQAILSFCTEDGNLLQCTT